MGLKLFMLEKEYVSYFRMYQLYITTKDREICEIMFEAYTSAIECLESTKMDGLALAVVDNV